MANQRITRKAGTTEPETITVQTDGNALDLSNVDWGQWKMWDPHDGTVVIDPEANGASSDGPGFAITDAGAGEVELDPDGAKKGGGNAFGDSGTYRATLTLHFPDGDEEIWPDEGYLTIELEDPGP